MASIDLGGGLVTLVDDADLPIVAGVKWRARKPNPRAGYYVYGPRMSMHRLLTGCPKGLEVDHINHDTLDNRRENLRICTHVENMRNGKFALATHCPRGHAYDEANTYRDARGRRCKVCNAERQARLRAAETPEQREKRKEYMRDYFQKRKAS